MGDSTRRMVIGVAVGLMIGLAWPQRVAWGELRTLQFRAISLGTNASDTDFIDGEEVDISLTYDVDVPERDTNAGNPNVSQFFTPLSLSISFSLSGIQIDAFDPMTDAAVWNDFVTFIVEDPFTIKDSFQVLQRYTNEGASVVGEMATTLGPMTPTLLQLRFEDEHFWPATPEMFNDDSLPRDPFDPNNGWLNLVFNQQTTILVNLTQIEPHIDIPGDANGDGFVTFADFSVLQNHFNMPGTFEQGDFNGDGMVTVADFAILQNNFDGPAPPALSALTSPAVTPEPGTAVLLATLMGAAGLRRRRASGV